MTRIFHPYDKWEDYRHGFYGGMDYPKDKTLELCASLFKDLPKFEAALKTIINEWHYSCEHNLTNEAMNRIAYLGQASCALVYNVPSSVCVGGYNLLSLEERKAADDLAEKYLNIWSEKHEHTKKV
jgi:hypothetical protein